MLLKPGTGTGRYNTPPSVIVHHNGRDVELVVTPEDYMAIEQSRFQGQKSLTLYWELKSGGLGYYYQYKWSWLVSLLK
jgi:hypothetical protein